MITVSQVALGIDGHVFKTIITNMYSMIMTKQYYLINTLAKTINSYNLHHDHMTHTLMIG